jgi:hypothetical protein
MALNLDELIATYNGTALLEAGHQEWGYIDDIWYLAVPDTYATASEENKKYWEEIHLGRSAFIDYPLFTKQDFIKANYQRLFRATNSPELALFGTLYRMTLVDQGLFCSDKGKRRVAVDEYVIVKPINNRWDAAENNLPVIVASNAIAAYAKRFSTTFIAHLAFIFSARGHHYAPEYNEHYKRLQDACFITSPSAFPMPSNEFLYRSFVHCFGVHPIIELALAFNAASKLPSAMKLRFDPHPPIAGCAHITTLKAILNAMEKEVLWKTIGSKFDREVDLINQEVALIRKSPFLYHVSSRCISGQPRVMVSQHAMEAFNKLSQLALGYLEYLGNKHSLYGQKAVTAKAGGVGPTAETWEDAFNEYGTPDIRSLTTAEFLAEMFPERGSVERKIRRLEVKRAKDDRKDDLVIRKEQLEVAKLETEMRDKGIDIPKVTYDEF